MNKEFDGPVAPGVKPVAEMRIEITDDGPYSVSGNVPLVRAEIVTNEAGESVAWRETGRIDAGETYLLCRCGHSGNEPFCDGSHVARV